MENQTIPLKETISNCKLDHIAYAVKSTDKSIKAFSLIYPKIIQYKCVEKNQNVLITYLSTQKGDHYIELVEPLGEENPVKNILKTKDSAMYHLCYRVNDFKQSIALLKKNKYLMITTPFETAVEKGVWACHFFNPESGIIEIMGVNNNE